jgi:DNA-binding MarR family transcriptional regulator
MSQAYVPYNGTAGWSGTDTSRERALINLRTGKEYNNQQKALALLKIANVNGLTWKELATETGWHHGTASGVLSVLHQSGAIVRLYQTRNRCKVYIHQDFKDGMLVEKYKKREKFCPHCGNDINA